MNSREQILGKVKAANQKLKGNTALPSDDELLLARSNNTPRSDALVETFCTRWTGVSGLLVRSEEELISFLQSQEATTGFIDPALGLTINKSMFNIDSAYDPGKVDTYQFCITPAIQGIAETGSIVLNDETTPHRLSALAPWIHIAVLTENSIVSGVGDAIACFNNDPSIIFVTGPSKTADIEGILIEGVHGPGKQVCFLI